MRPPYETFTKPTCKGSIALRTACGHCEKCEWERKQRDKPQAAALCPKAMEFDLGNDAYGRPVTLRFRRNYDGKDLWDLRTEPTSQLDDGERMGSLTADNLRAIARAVQ